MNTNDVEVYFDCGTSKIRACAFNKKNTSECFYHESAFLPDHSNIKFEMQKIISGLEGNNSKYLNNINLMIDSPKMLSIGLSVSKRIDGIKLQKQDIQFLIQDAKQQILRNYFKQNIVHIVIRNYKIDSNDYEFLPTNVECDLISLDIIFICLPKITIEYYKKIFFELDISVDQIFCTSYAKSISYKENFSSIKHLSFIDIGLSKTSINLFYNDKIIFSDIIPIGGNHITKDISKVLQVDLQEAENLKLLLANNQKSLNERKNSFNLIQEIISARIEEILDLCIKSTKLNFDSMKPKIYKMVIAGEGSKIFNNKFRKKFNSLNNIIFHAENNKETCHSGFKIIRGLNKQEVVIIPKKTIKVGFFERLFHLFK